jgi:hypothetical protein
MPTGAPTECKGPALLHPIAPKAGALGARLRSDDNSILCREFTGCNAAPAPPLSRARIDSVMPRTDAS